MFHRLNPPSYFVPGGGPLPSGYDYLNDPVAGGSGGGIAAPADTGAKSGGTYDGTYFVGEDAEAVNAFNTNRLGAALGTNTDFIDDILNADIATQFFDDTSSGHGGSNSHAINASVDGLWLSNNGSESPLNLFAVTTLDGDPIVIGGTIVAVTSVTGASIGDGFVRTNPVTLHFNKTIPDALGFRVLYGIQSSYRRVPLDAYFRPNIYRTRQVRGIVATVSDNTTSKDGDFNTAILDGIVKSALSVYDDGLYRVSPGSYSITSAVGAWNKKVRLDGEDATITIDAGYAGGLNTVVPVVLQGISLRTASTTAFFEVSNEFFYDGLARGQNLIEFGALQIQTTVGQHVTIRGAIGTGNATLTAADAGILIQNSGIITLSDLDFSSGAPTASGATYEAALKVDTFDGQLYVSNCKFAANTATSSALKLHNAHGNIYFSNCSFNCATAGSGFGITADTCSGVVFEDCTFTATAGQAAQLINSGIQFINCKFLAGTNTGQTNPQLLCGEGFAGDVTHPPAPLIFDDCIAQFTAANVRASGAPTKPIIELGGHGGGAVAGRVVTRGLIILASTNTLGVHNYTTVVLHNPSASNSSVFGDISIDMKANVPAASGTLGAFNGSFEGKGFVIEAVGTASRSKMIVRNLKLLNVGWPASAIARSVAGFAYCDVDGLVIDGTGASSGSYSKVLFETTVSVLRDVRFFPFAGLKSTASTSGAIGKLVSSEICGLRYHHQSSFTTAAAPLFSLGIDSKISNGLIYVNTAFGGGFAVVAFNDSRASLVNSTIFMGGVCNGPVIFGVQSEMEVSNNNVTWQNALADGTLVIVNLVPNHGVCIGNRFLTTSADAPVPSYIPSNSIPTTITDLNVVDVGAEATPPTVY